MKDAEDADRESIDGSEIDRIDAAHSAFSCSLSYLRHLNNADSHRALLKKVTKHLWQKKKNDEAVRKISMYASLLQ